MKLLLMLILVASIYKLIACSGHFTVFGSKFITRNRKYNVAITSRNFNVSNIPILEVVIDTVRGTDNVIGKMVENITLSNREMQNLEFDMKDQPDGDYFLSVNCKRGLPLVFNKRVQLNITKVSIIVQTDKTIYKADDKVQFRVLILNKNLKPLSESNVQIFVTDGADNRVKQFDDIVFVSGVFQGELKLSESPILGHWHIVVCVNRGVNNKIEERKWFEVGEYTLPTLKLRVDVKPHVNFNEKIINASIVTNYTFGEKASGKATITAQVEHNHKISKSIDVIGNASVEFHIENDLGIREKNKDRIVRLFVTFTEVMTGRALNATANVTLHVLPYKITMSRKSDKFKPRLPFTIEAIVQYHDNSPVVDDIVNPVSFNVTMESVFGNTSWMILKDYPTNGISKIDIPIEEDIVKLNVTAKYLQTEITEYNILVAPSETDHYITITSKTEAPSLSENVKINIQSVKAFTDFSYHVLTTVGRVIISDTIHVNSTKNYDFEFTPTHDMEADMKIIVFYFAAHGQIISDSLLLQFNERRNFVDISIPDPREYPNGMIDITIKSSHDSFVGILGVDQSVMIEKGGNDISDSVFEKIKEPTGPDVFFMTYPGRKTHVLQSLDEESIGRLTEIETAVVEPEEMRTNFLETWLFENVYINEANTTVITRKVPDSITSFRITAFSINPTTGFAITKRPTELSVFKRMFILIDLPYSVKLGEIVSIPIVVHNYLPDDQEAIITLFNEDSEFAFVGVEGETNPQGLVGKAMTKKIFVKNQSKAITSFKIRACRIGSVKIKAFVTSTLSAGDGMERYLLVKPEGNTKSMNQAVFMDLRDSREYTKDIYISIPPEAVNNSIKIEASMVGDILGLPIENVNKLINLPHAGGEENMVTFVRNIVVLNYLTAVKQLTPKINSELTNCSEIGYQKQLSYRHADGSFSVWRNREKSGSTWLTAFVAKSFRQAAEYIFVDSEVITNALNFLAKKQSEAGSFVEDEDTGHSTYVQGGLSDEMALTSYTLIAFLENNDYVEEYKTTIEKSLAWLSKNFNNITDNYSLAITAYAFQLATNYQLDDETLRNRSLARLEENAIMEGETMRWEVNLSEFHQNLTKETNSLDIETTAYALLALIEADRVTDSARVVKWLVSQRNENGGFISTQDTAIGLQAMSKAARIMYSTNTGLNVTVQHSDNNPTVFSVNKMSALLRTRKDLPSSERHFKITANGEGFGIFQISYQYNIDTPANEIYKFKIGPVRVSKTINKSTFCLEVCTNYIPDAEMEKSKTAVMEVNFPSGCTFREDLSNELHSTKEVKVDDHKTSVVIFVSNLTVSSLCQQFFFSRDTIVESLRPASIHVYDYHNIKRRAKTFYNLPSNEELSTDFQSIADDTLRPATSSSMQLPKFWTGCCVFVVLPYFDINLVVFCLFVISLC